MTSRAPFTVANEHTRKRVIDVLMALDLTKRWRVVIEPEKKRRSLNQNALMWKWHGIVAEATGHTANEIHEWAKLTFLPPAFITIDGKTVEIRKSTTDLDTREMSRFMDNYNAWAASEMGLVLPHPDDMGREVAA